VAGIPSVPSAPSFFVNAVVLDICCRALCVNFAVLSSNLQPVFISRFCFTLWWRDVDVRSFLSC